MVCPKCGHRLGDDGRCVMCGFYIWGVTDASKHDLSVTELELKAIRLRNRIRRAINKIITYEHKGVIAAIVLILLVLLTAVSLHSCIGA